MTLEQIGKQMNVSREYVRQIKSKAIRKLRKNAKILMLYRESVVN